MKKIVLILSKLYFALNLLSAQELCVENNGNIEISQAYRWRNNLHVFLENGSAFHIKDFRWDGKDFSVGKSESIVNWINNYKFPFNLVFTVNYPKLGPRLLTFQWKQMEELNDWVIFIHELEDSGLTKKSSSLSINLNQCDTEVSISSEPMRLCRLFSKFDAEDIRINIRSILMFPKTIRELPQRFLTYFRAPLPINEQSESETLRHVVIGVNTTFNGSTQFDWVIDNSSSVPKMERVVLDATTVLSDYKWSGGSYRFDFIEFFGTQFRVNRISVTKEKVFPDIEEVKTGPIGLVFGCQPPTDKPVNIEEAEGIDETQPIDIQNTESIVPSPQTPSTVSEAPHNDSNENSGGFPVALIIVGVIVVIILIGIIFGFFLFRNAGAFTTYTTGKPSETEKPSEKELAHTSKITGKKSPQKESNEGKITLKTPPETEKSNSSVSSIGSTLSTPSTVSIRSDMGTGTGV